MAVTRYLQKAPNEVERFSMDFSARLGPGEVLSSAEEVTITPAGELEASTPALVEAVTGGGLKVATALFSDGEAGVDYEVLWEVTTSGGETLQECGTIGVKECRDIKP